MFQEDWSTLPVDVIINIAKHCGRRELQNCRLVNRHWSSGADFVISSLHFTKELVSSYSSWNAALQILAEKFRNVETVALDGNISADLEPLCKTIPNLTSLDLFGMRHRKKSALNCISDLHSLKHINLGGSNICGSMITTVTNCPLLETLDLWRTDLDVYDVGAVLPYLKNLTNLNLGYTKLHDSEMDFLSSLSHLKYLDLGNTSIGSKTLKSLSTVISLKSLFLDYTKTDDSGIVYLSQLTNLVDLNLGNTNISDAGLSSLTTLTNLMDLKLGNTNVSDAGLFHLSSLCNLMYVYLDGTNVRDAGVNFLTTLMPHLHVQIRLDSSGIQL